VASDRRAVTVPCVAHETQFRDLILSRIIVGTALCGLFHPPLQFDNCPAQLELRITQAMSQSISQIVVEPDAFHVSRDPILLTAKLQAAVAVCVHDDTQGAGGLLHLLYMTHSHDAPLDLTDNTLSTDLLLLDRFCKELRTFGARKQSWRVRLIGHVPPDDGAHTPAATLLDLLRAYFADSRIAAEYKEVRSESALSVRLNAREGDLSVTKAS
jgi:hypothetical protein